MTTAHDQVNWLGDVIVVTAEKYIRAGQDPVSDALADLVVVLVHRC